MTLEEWCSDPDAQLDAWYEVQGADAHAEYLREQRTHRCPSDMPPCPECEARTEEEIWREFGNS